MRLLPAIAIAQALGIVAADRGWLGRDFAVASGAALLVAALAIRFESAGVRALAVALAFCAGAASLSIRLDSASARAIEASRSTPSSESPIPHPDLSSARAVLPAEPLVVEATLVDSASGPNWWRADLAGVRAVDANPLRVPARIRLIGGAGSPGSRELREVERGTRIRAMVALRAPHEPQNPGARDDVRRLERRGIGALGRLVHPSLHVTLHSRWNATPIAAIREQRRAVSSALANAGEGSGLVRALALGDRGGLAPEAREAFARLGLSHLLAVSGLHLALVASLAFALVRTSAGRSAWLAARCDTRRIALGAGVFAAIAYALLSGWAIPVRRSLVFLLVLALAVLRGRSRSRAEPLAAAVIAVLAVEPAALFEVGAQLSFAATAALLFAAGRPARSAFDATEGLRRAVVDLTRASASAVAVTAPIASWQLGTAAPFALFANFVAIPWTAFALLPASLFAALAIASGCEAIAAPLVWLAVRIADATLALGFWASDLLPTTLPVARPTDAYRLATAVVVALTLLARATLLRVLGALVVSAIVALAPPRSLLPRPPRLVALEVGQGSATLVEGRRAAVLVDAGGALVGRDWGKRAVVPALAALGVESLDVLIVSHGDLDHSGGVTSVLDAVSVGEVWLPHGALAEPAFGRILDAARARKIPVLTRGAGSPARSTGDLRIEPLWPLPLAGRGSRNDRSLVVRIEVAGRRVLLPGDLEARAESDLEASGVDLRAEVLALPHHGSRTSSTAAFLRAVGATAAIASSPCGGRFGMPHADVLERARDVGLSVWWTGRDGAVMVGLGRPLTVWGYGDRSRSAACRTRSTAFRAR